MPFGLLKGLFLLANDYARDIENSKRFPNSIIDKGSSFTIDVTIGKNSKICSNVTINHSTIGSYTYINKNSMIQHANMGNYCSISHGVLIGLGAHPINLFSTSPIFYKVKNTLNIKLIEKDYNFNEYHPINIGSDVWIGAGAIIMDGVTIGHGAIIAAGAVVTKDVIPYAIVAGVPAKTIKSRFTNTQIQHLLKTEWWNEKPEAVKDLKFEI